MDDLKLKDLRRRFGDGAGRQIYDPRFKMVAEAQIDIDGRRFAPYSGRPTILDAEAVDDFAELDIALVGVPMDLGVSNRPGARFGPRAVRTIERVGPYHHALDRSPMLEARVADIGDVPFRSRFSLESSLEDIELFYRELRAANVRPLSIGGDHSITYPIMKALGADRPLGMVHFDAHCDTSGEFDQSKFHHGGPFRLAVLDGVLDPDRCIQIGIRGASEFLWEFSEASGMTVLHIEDVLKMSADDIIRKAREVVGSGPTYVTFDIDSLDPSYAPGTGTPEVGGLSPHLVQTVIRGLDGLDLVGGDVVELAPQYDATTNSAQVTAQIAFEILTILTQAR